MLGQKVAGKYHLRYCGDGDVAALLEGAVGGARRRRQGARRPAGRRPGRSGRKPRRGDDHFSPLPLTTMQYTNKPTGIHQVVTYGG